MDHFISPPTLDFICRGRGGGLPAPIPTTPLPCAPFGCFFWGGGGLGVGVLGVEVNQPLPPFLPPRLKWDGFSLSFFLSLIRWLLLSRGFQAEAGGGERAGDYFATFSPDLLLLYTNLPHGTKNVFNVSPLLNFCTKLSNIALSNPHPHFSPPWKGGGGEKNYLSAAVGVLTRGNLSWDTFLPCKPSYPALTTYRNHIRPLPTKYSARGRNQKQASPLFTMGGREPEMGLLIGWPKKGPFLRHISDGLCVGNNKSDFCQILCISGEGLGPFFRSLAIFSEGVNSVRFPFFFFPSLDGHKGEKGPFLYFLLPGPFSSEAGKKHFSVG